MGDRQCRLQAAEAQSERHRDQGDAQPDYSAGCTARLGLPNPRAFLLWLPRAQSHGSRLRKHRTRCRTPDCVGGRRQPAGGLVEQYQYGLENRQRGQPRSGFESLPRRLRSPLTRMVERNLAVATTRPWHASKPAQLSESAVQAQGTSRPTIAQLIVQNEPQLAGGRINPLRRRAASGSLDYGRAAGRAQSPVCERFES